MSQATEFFFLLSAIVWFSLTIVVVPVAGGWLTCLAWKFFAGKVVDENAWPFGKDLIQLYKWSGVFNYELGTLYKINGKPRGWDIASLDNVSWERVLKENGAESYWRINMEFNTRRLDEVTMQVFEEKQPDSKVDDVYKQAADRMVKSLKATEESLKATEESLKATEEQLAKAAKPEPSQGSPYREPAAYPLSGCHCGDCAKARKEGKRDLYPFHCVQRYGDGTKVREDWIWADTTLAATDIFANKYGAMPTTVVVCDLPNRSYKKRYEEAQKLATADKEPELKSKTYESLADYIRDQKPMTWEDYAKAMGIPQAVFAGEPGIKIEQIEPKRYNIIRKCDNKIVLSHVKGTGTEDVMRRFMDHKLNVVPVLGVPYFVAEMLTTKDQSKPQSKERDNNA